MVSLLYDIDDSDFSVQNEFIENLDISSTYYDSSVLEQEYDAS